MSDSGVINNPPISAFFPNWWFRVPVLAFGIGLTIYIALLLRRVWRLLEIAILEATHEPEFDFEFKPERPLQPCTFPLPPSLNRQDRELNPHKFEVEVEVHHPNESHDSDPEKETWI